MLLSVRWWWTGPCSTLLPMGKRFEWDAVAGGRCKLCTIICFKSDLERKITIKSVSVLHVEYLSCWRGWRTCRRTFTTHPQPAAPLRMDRWTCVWPQEARRASVRYLRKHWCHQPVSCPPQFFPHFRCLRCWSTQVTMFSWMHLRILAHLRQWDDLILQWCQLINLLTCSDFLLCSSSLLVAT